MLTHILLPLDGSFLAQISLDFVKRMATVDCKITLLTSVSIPSFPTYTIVPMQSFATDHQLELDTVRADAAYYLEAIADDLRQSGYLVDVRVEVGEPANYIVQVAEELDIDMAIMATHGHSGISRWLLGSVTARVLSTATRPVLVVPSSSIEEEFERQSPEVNYG